MTEEESRGPSGRSEQGAVVGRYVDESTPHWPAAAAAPAGAPNVVFIVLDDVGFSDLGCFGGEIRHRNIDRLAARGLRYNNFHTTALCSPTRACLLTGRNHHSVGMGVVSNWDTGLPRLSRPHHQTCRHARRDAAAATGTTRTRSASGTSRPPTR